MSKGVQKAFLVLKDGAVFEGIGFGHATRVSGEVVFNTAMTGYQEILTDPSYAGQIVVMTNPHIGNYGVNDADVEATKIYAAGLVVREASPVYSNHRAQTSLADYLKRARMPGLAEIDTRALTRHIRDCGAMPAILAVGNPSVAGLKRKAGKLSGMEGQNLASKVSTKRDYVCAAAEGRGLAEKNFRVVAYDYGIKQNILRLLAANGCDVTVVPYDYPAEKVLTENVDGVFLSNGPGDPAPCVEAVATVKKILGRKPIFGICLGHQILALALGAKTYKLKFGHHGANQPVKELATGRVEITSQNHGFAVDPDTLTAEVAVTHVHLNDNTVAGISSFGQMAFSVQYHPEASPGPHDSRYLFQRFVRLMEETHA